MECPLLHEHRQARIVASQAQGRFRRWLTAIRQWRIIETVELIETSTFTRQITALLSDGDYGAFQSRLAAIQISDL